jgi:hypothetical protein
MMNNKFHPAQSANYTNCLAAFKLKSDAWSREAAMASRLPGTFMEQLFPYGPIGAHLEWMWMRLEFKYYWDPFNWPFMAHLNPSWYLRTRLGMDPATATAEAQKGTVPFTSAWPRVKVVPYDCCAAVGVVGDDFMRAMGVLSDTLPSYNTEAHGHRVFGSKPDDLGGVNGAAMAKVLEAFLLGSLRATAPAARKLPAFKTLVHDTVKPSRFDAGFLLEELLPHLRAEMAHKAQATRLRAEAARKPGPGERPKTQQEVEQLTRQAAEEDKKAARSRADLLAVPGVDRNNPPTRDDIPYEAMFQMEMEKVKRAKRAAAGRPGGR